nr:hypothetical protein [Tanacetum cinerariifolium]
MVCGVDGRYVTLVTLHGSAGDVGGFIWPKPHYKMFKLVSFTKNDFNVKEVDPMAMTMIFYCCVFVSRGSHTSVLARQPQNLDKVVEKTLEKNGFSGSGSINYVQQKLSYIEQYELEREKEQKLEEEEELIRFREILSKRKAQETTRGLNIAFTTGETFEGNKQQAFGLCAQSGIRYLQPEKAEDGLKDKIWILESYPNSRKWWSKNDNVLQRALAWSNVTKFEKNDYNHLFGPLYATHVEKQAGWFFASIQFINGLVDEDFLVSQDDGVGVVSDNCVDLQHNSISVVYVFSANFHEGLYETRVGNNDMLLMEGVDGFLDSEGCAKNLKSDKDKQPTLADVLDEVRALRKEVALVKFDDARIAKLERILNDNFMFRNDIPNGNHKFSTKDYLVRLIIPWFLTCSRLDIDNAEVAGHVIGIHNADGKMIAQTLTCSGPDILDGKVAGALIGIHNADGKNDILNVNHNAVNKGLSSSANDLMSTCSSPNMDNGEVAVAGMGIYKADGQKDIPNANHNVVNQGICGSANDPMLDVLIQVACDGMGIDKADRNNDNTYSQQPGDGITTIKCQRHDIHGDGVRDLAMMLGRGQLKVDLEPSTSRRRQEEVLSFDKMKPQPQPLPYCPPLDINLGDKRGPKPPIKPPSPDSFRIKEVNHLTNHTPPSPHVASFYHKDVYCYYHPCVEDPKKHYRFKLGLLGHNGSLGVDFLNFKMIKDEWRLESKEVFS